MSAAAKADRKRDILVVPRVAFFLWGCLLDTSEVREVVVVVVVVLLSSQGRVELEMEKGKMSRSSSRSPLERISSPVLDLLPSIHLKWRREKEKEASWGLLAMMVLIFAVFALKKERERENLLRSGVVWRGEKERRQVVDLFYASSPLCQRGVQLFLYCGEREREEGEVS